MSVGGNAFASVVLERPKDHGRQTSGRKPLRDSKRRTPGDGVQYLGPTPFRSRTLTAFRTLEQETCVMRTHYTTMPKPKHMSYAALLERLGFDADPFAKTNADEEERLNQYFIPPPFFSAVYGDLGSPKSSVVFAPRGGGKTALKRKIEMQSEDDPLLCVTYNHFDVTGKRLSEINGAFHLSNVIRRLLVAILTGLHGRGIEALSKEDRHMLYVVTKAHLSKLDQSQLKETIDAVKTFGDAAKEWWNSFIGPVGVLVNGILAKVGFPEADVKQFEEDGGTPGSLLDQIGFLRRMAQILGFKCIYVLVDRIDENALTNASGKNSFTFIASLLTDLQVLELDGVSFKFFLWDLLLDDYRKVARPDRVKYYALKWEHKQLESMLSERLKAHSANKVSSLDELCHLSGKWNLDQLVTIFAQGSPRNVIRICKEVLDQQSELGADSMKITPEAVSLGFAAIAQNMSAELFEENIIRDLQRTKRCDFTIRYVYSDVFKFTQPAALNKVRSWEDAGAVMSLGTIQATPGAKPSNHYGIGNWLLAKHIHPEINIRDFSDIKLRLCPGCGQALIRDWDITATQTCHQCQIEILPESKY